MGVCRSEREATEALLPEGSFSWSSISKRERSASRRRMCLSTWCARACMHISMHESRHAYMYMCACIKQCVQFSCTILCIAMPPLPRLYETLKLFCLNRLLGLYMYMYVHVPHTCMYMYLIHVHVRYYRYIYSMW